MKILVQVTVITCLAILYYTYLGHYVPQKEALPPEEAVITAEMTPEEMAEAGEEIFNGKGICNTCHKIGETDAAQVRFPDLAGIGAVAGSRRAGMSDVEYLVESLYEPDAYIVEGFNPGMTPSNKAPINLTDEQIMAVIAFMQSLGGTPTVTLATATKYWTPTGGGETTAEAVPEEKAADTSGGAAAATEELPADAKLLKTYACITCHSLEKGKKGLGPSFYGVGKRLSEAKLYESIMNPDIVLAEGFEAGVMPATLESNEFYKKVTAGELKEIVAFLKTQVGGN